MTVCCSSLSHIGLCEYLSLINHRPHGIGQATWRTPKFKLTGADSASGTTHTSSYEMTAVSLADVSYEDAYAIDDSLTLVRLSVNHW